MHLQFVQKIEKKSRWCATVTTAKNSPMFESARLDAAREKRGDVAIPVRLLTELGGRMREARNLAVRCIAMDDALLRGTHDLGLGGLQRGERGGLVAGGDCLLDLAHGGTHPRAASLVDF